MEHFFFFINLLILITGIASVSTLFIFAKRGQIHTIYLLYWFSFSLLFFKEFLESYIIATSLKQNDTVAIIISVIGIMLKFNVIIFASIFFFFDKYQKKPIIKFVYLFLLICIIIFVLISIVLKGSEILSLYHRIFDLLILVTLFVESLVFIFINKLKGEAIYFNSAISLIIFSLLSSINYLNHLDIINISNLLSNFFFFHLHYFIWSIYLIIFLITKNTTNKKLDSISKDKLQKYEISNREHDVLKLVIKGLTRIEIAEKLFISPRTVDNHIANIFRKFGVKNKVELIRELLD